MNNQILSKLIKRNFNKIVNTDLIILPFCLNSHFFCFTVYNFKKYLETITKYLEQNGYQKIVSVEIAKIMSAKKEETVMVK